MAEQPRNGYDPTRLDRIEGLIDVLVNQHIEFAEEHKKLLTAQVVLTDRIDKLTKRVDDLTVSVKVGFEEHKQAMREFDARLNALIAFTDAQARNRPLQ